jgi:DNA polymerase III delta prime subunit
MKIRKVSVATNVSSSDDRRTSVMSSRGAGRNSVISQLGGKKKKGKKKELINMDDIVINPNLIYAERELWTLLNSLWKRYCVYKPRLPDGNDETQRWADLPDNSPRAFNGFIGNHNDEFFAQLNSLFTIYENNFQIPEIMIITGPSGSGKSSIMKIFVQKLIDEQSLNATQANKWYLYINAQDYSKDLSILWNKLNRFAEPNFEKFLTSKFRLILIDNFQYISPSAQQSFKKLYLTHIGKLRYIFITPEPKGTIISFFISKAVTLKTSAINERDALSVILSICFRNHIGYELEGVKAVFELHNKIHEQETHNNNNNAAKAKTSTAASVTSSENNSSLYNSLQYLNVSPNLISLSLILELMQRVFLDRHFISKDNVFRVLNKPFDPLLIKPLASIEPLERCLICTLFPPCSHITLGDMNELGLERRSELPNRGRNALICPEFKRFGRCTMFNTNGHCSLHHPKKIHVIEKPLVRCQQCTIPWPCNHCSYTSRLNNVQTIIDEIKFRMGRLRQINVPEPPVSLIRHLENVPNWKEEIARIDRAYVKPDNLNKLKEIQEWILTAYCVESEEYDQQAKILIDAFGDLLVTDLLNMNRKAAKAEAKNAANNLEGSIHKDNASLVSGWNDSTIATEE